MTGGRSNNQAYDGGSVSGGCDQLAGEQCQHLPACEDNCLPDANADAMIDVQDLIAVILNWGVCEQ